jgi:hypothetical protein
MTEYQGGTMKIGLLAVGGMFLAGLTSVTEARAAEPDEALCRGPYPVMLMTERECRLYVDEVQALRSQGRLQKLAAVQQQHAGQLNERAAACLCVEQSAQAIAPQQVVMLDPDC